MAGDEEDYFEEETEYEGVVDMEDDESYYKKVDDNEEDELDKQYNEFFEDEEEQKGQDVEYEYDEIVGARDKKPVLSALNKTKLSKMEMDELFNQY